MKSATRLLYSLIVLLLASQVSDASDARKSCLGEWDIEAVNDEAYRSNFNYKYPKSLSINELYAEFTNQFYYGGGVYNADYNCSVKYWSARDSHIIFETCLPSQRTQSPTLSYKIKCEKEVLGGSVWRGSRKLFELTGHRKKNDSK